MGTTFEGILEGLLLYRDQEYRSDPDRNAARLDAIECALQSTLEKLRDLHDPE